MNASPEKIFSVRQIAAQAKRRAACIYTHILAATLTPDFIGVSDGRETYYFRESRIPEVIAVTSTQPAKPWTAKTAMKAEVIAEVEEAQARRLQIMGTVPVDKIVEEWASENRSNAGGAI